MVAQVARLVAVLALLGVAAAVATPKGRLPLALRGMLAVLKGDGTVRTGETGRTGTLVPWWKRLLAFVLVLLAVLLAVI